jgi:hypothetical protein
VFAPAHGPAPPLDQLAACLQRLAQALERDGPGWPQAGLLLDESA